MFSECQSIIITHSSRCETFKATRRNKSTSRMGKCQLSQRRRDFAQLPKPAKRTFLHPNSPHPNPRATGSLHASRTLNDAEYAEAVCYATRMPTDKASEPPRRASVTMYDQARDAYTTVTDDVLERKVHTSPPSQSQAPRREEAGTFGLGPAAQGMPSGPAVRASELSLSAVSKDCSCLSFYFVGIRHLLLILIFFVH